MAKTLRGRPKLTSKFRLNFDSVFWKWFCTLIFIKYEIDDRTRQIEISTWKLIQFWKIPEFCAANLKTLIFKKLLHNSNFRNLAEKSVQCWVKWLSHLFTLLSNFYQIEDRTRQIRENLSWNFKTGKTVWTRKFLAAAGFGKTARELEFHLKMVIFHALSKTPQKLTIAR